MLEALNAYKQLDRNFYKLFTAQLLLNLTSISFMLIFNIYLKKLGYEDAAVGRFTSMRYLGVLLLSLPLGLYIRGRSIRPFFVVSAFSAPALSLLVLEAVRAKLYYASAVLMLLWGMSFVFMQVGLLPYVMRATKEHVRAEAIAFLYTNFSWSQILSGLLIAALIRGFGLDELNTLRVVSLLGLSSLFLICNVKDTPPRYKRVSFKLSALKTVRNSYDWPLVLRALAPTLALSIGAGLTFPFMNVFFFQTFGVDSEQYSLLASFTALIVVVGTLFVPRVRKQYGYKIAITASQVLALLVLGLLIVTAVFPEWRYALPAALACFVVRQPLMHIPVPMTRELAMLYVGEENRELMSALIASTRSGSYFFSGEAFAFIRAQHIPFYGVFLATALIYVVGVLTYYKLILSFERRNRGRAV